MYIYQRIDGELYSSNRYLTFEEIQYEEKHDWFLGIADNRESAWRLLKPKCKKNNGITKEKAKKFIEKNWEE